MFIISRSVNTEIPQEEGPDYFSRAKYLKPKDSQLPEPIYGTDTIEEGVPLVITEGIADAITAHEYGIPCISPVTTRFKDQHYSVLYNLVIENDIPEVYIIQDADPPNTSVAERFTQSYHDNYDSAGGSDQREPEKADNLWDALTVDQYGPGFEGAVKTARYLRQKAESRAEGVVDDGQANGVEPETNGSEADSGDEISTSLKEAPADIDECDYPEMHGKGTTDVAFETYIITLPRFGGIKYDLDDYLSDGMAQITPPAKWVDNLLDYDTPSAWIGRLERNGDLQFVDPRDYTGDHSVGEMVSGAPLEDDTNERKETIENTQSTGESIDGEDEDSTTETANENSKSRTILSPLPTRATTLNYLPTLTGGDKALGINIDPLSSREDSEMDSMQSGSTSTDADMWDLTMYDVFGISEDYRGKSPFGHIGESENYFVSMTPTRAYCFKRKATYTPATGVLVKEGERYAKDPEGELSDWETFVYWRYLREKGIVNDNPPNKALVAYAKRHNIASSGDGISTREGEFGEFESLDKDRLYQVLDDIERRFNIDIEWDPFGDRGNKSDNSSDGESGTDRRTGGSESADSDGQTPTDQSTSSGDSTGSSDQRASTTESGETTSSGAATESSQSSSESSSPSSQNEADHNDTQSTEDSDSPNNTEVESTLATSDTVDSTNDSSEPDSPANEDRSEGDDKSTSQDSETTHTGDESPVVKSASDNDQPKQTDSDEDVDPIKQRHDSNRQSEDQLDVAVEVEGGVNLNDVEEEMNSDDPHDRFNTYEEPDADEGEYDPDREAVKQFVAGFCRVDGDRKDELKAPKDDVFNALIKWIKINGVEVDDLSDDVYITNRKGNLKNILTDEYDVISKQFSIDGERVRGFRGMRLSDSGEELLNVEID